MFRTNTCNKLALAKLLTATPYMRADQLEQSNCQAGSAGKGKAVPEHLILASRHPHTRCLLAKRFPSIHSHRASPSRSMPPLRARAGALKTLTSAQPHRHPTRSILAGTTYTAPIQSSQSLQGRAQSSAHPADSSEAEHPSSHSDHYDPPSGWLFNVPPGEKYKKEGWENLFIYGFWGSILVGVVGYAYKPDTS